MVEVQSTVTHASGALTGTWKELSRNWSGELAGSITANGFKVAVKGSELNANMDIVVKDVRQIIESDSSKLPHRPHPGPHQRLSRQD